MSNFPSKQNLVKAVLDGIVKAADSFWFWTNGRLLLSHGPQKIISLHVATQIAKIENAPEIFIDATVSDILRCSLSKRDKFPEFMKKSDLKQGIFSITLDERFEHKNDDDSVSKVIISVKNGVRNTRKEHIDEIERICKMLDRSTCKENSLDYGIFAMYADLSDNARKKLEKRIPEIIKNFDAVVSKFSTLQGKFISTDIKKEKDGSEWIAACYVVEAV